MASAPSHPALDSVHTEKTPRRSPPPSGSVVVDPRSQLPSSSPPPSSGRRTTQSGGSGATRRKAETTLVLDARRVDTLRRQVLDRHRAQQHGRRWQVALWALAGAGALLLGGWLARRLSPTAADRESASLVLGRSEGDGANPPLEAPPAVEGQAALAVGETADTRTASGARVARDGAAPGDHRSNEPGRMALAAQPSAAQRALDTGERSRAEGSQDERSPEDPKVVGDWGDGFDATGQRAHRRAPASTGPTGTDAVNLDDLPTE
jgi:hypothetical protein